MKAKYFVCAAALAFMFVSCDKVENEEGTGNGDGNTLSITLSSQNVEVPASGGQYSVEYEFVGDPISIEAVCPEAWVNGLDYSQTGIISFNVDANTVNESREAVVTIISPDAEGSATFTVTQQDPSHIELSELLNSRWTARICQFDREKTFFQILTETLEITSQYITAGEYAEQYATDWNAANPDNILSAEDFLYFQYTDSATAGTTGTMTYFNVTFGETIVEVEDGMMTPAGGARVVRATGEFSYDPETKILTIEDVGNENYTRDVVVQLGRENGELTYEVIKTWWPDYLQYYFGSKDQFGFNLNNYDVTEFYKPHGSLKYYLYKDENYTPGSDSGEDTGEDNTGDENTGEEQGSEE